MENNFEENEQYEYSLKRKLWFEFKDLMAGSAFPLIISAVFSATIMSFSISGEVDLAIRLLSIIGGELMLGVAFFIFGRANGSEAYKTTVENGRKRELGSIDEKVKYRTGEYSLWKGALIGLIICLPYIIILTIQLCVYNTFCTFMLEYIFAWATAPFSFLDKSYLALGYIMIIFPIVLLTVGYFFGKLKQIKIQEALAKTNPDDKRSRVVDIPDKKSGKRRRK